MATATHQIHRCELPRARPLLEDFGPEVILSPYTTSIAPTAPPHHLTAPHNPTICPAQPLQPLPHQEDDTTTDIDEKIDIALWAAPWVAGFVYLLGAAVTHTKVPVYILLSFEYAVLTYRFWKVRSRASTEHGH